jgi:hypothetical protein
MQADSAGLEELAHRVVQKVQAEQDADRADPA